MGCAEGWHGATILNYIHTSLIASKQRPQARGEIVMPLDGFNQLNKKRMENGEEPFKNPRNTASGSLKLQDSKEVSGRPLECLYTL